MGRHDDVYMKWNGKGWCIDEWNGGGMESDDDVYMKWNWNGEWWWCIYEMKLEWGVMVYIWMEWNDDDEIGMESDDVYMNEMEVDAE